MLGTDVSIAIGVSEMGFLRYFLRVLEPQRVRVSKGRLGWHVYLCLCCLDTLEMSVHMWCTHLLLLTVAEWESTVVVLTHMQVNTGTVK